MQCVEVSIGALKSDYMILRGAAHRPEQLETLGPMPNWELRIRPADDPQPAPLAITAGQCLAEEA